MTDINRYTKKIYLQQYNDCELGRENWASKIKHILFNYGFEQVWLNQEVGDIRQFIAVVKDRLVNNNLQQRVTNINTLITVYIDNDDYFNVIPPYILCNFKISNRRLITLFRISS